MKTWRKGWAETDKKKNEGHAYKMKAKRKKRRGEHI